MKHNYYIQPSTTVYLMHGMSLMSTIGASGNIQERARLPLQRMASSIYK